MLATGSSLKAREGIEKHETPVASSKREEGRRRLSPIKLTVTCELFARAVVSGTFLLTQTSKVSAGDFLQQLEYHRSRTSNLHQRLGKGSRIDWMASFYTPVVLGVCTLVLVLALDIMGVFTRGKHFDVDGRVSRSNIATRLSSS
jgi:hypothetical protein